LDNTKGLGVLVLQRKPDPTEKYHNYEGSSTKGVKPCDHYRFWNLHQCAGSKFGLASD